MSNINHTERSEREIIQEYKDYTEALEREVAFHRKNVALWSTLVANAAGALRFYADREKYNGERIGNDMLAGTEPILEDAGERASRALDWKEAFTNLYPAFVLETDSLQDGHGTTLTMTTARTSGTLSLTALDSASRGPDGKFPVSVLRLSKSLWNRTQVARFAASLLFWTVTK